MTTKSPQKNGKKRYQKHSERKHRKTFKMSPKVAKKNNVHDFWDPFGIKMGTESRKAVIHANVRFT